jgi:AcrR family transcriptional regulator
VEEKLIQILGKVETVFWRYGVKSVTMDDIAKELKISKKTLYRFVKDKSDLVVKVLEGHCELDKVVVHDAIENAENAIDELMHVSEMLGQKLQQINPSFHYDLEKYYPKAWTVFSEHKENFILNCVKQNLERGVKEGIYRDNLNAEVISQLYIHKIDCIFDSAIFPVGKFTFFEVFLELMRYHIRGVSNEKGNTYLAQKIKKDHSNF